MCRVVNLNNGDGTFPSGNATPSLVWHYLTASSYADHLVCADFNGDGKPDLATVSELSGVVSILFNQGVSTTAAGARTVVFSAPVTYTLSQPGDTIIATDVNNDGKPDLIVGRYSGKSFSILLNNGDGTFGAEDIYPTAGVVSGLTAGDYNGDGRVDIATSGQFSPVTVTPNIGVRSLVSGRLTLEGISPSAPAQPVQFTFRVAGLPNWTTIAPVAPSGNFSLLLPRGDYTLRAKGAKYLAKNMTVAAAAGDVSGISAFLPAGDANNDNSVDSTDFGILIGAFNTDSSIPGSGYDPTADFNGDGFVDSTDFGLLVGEFNNSGDL